MSMRVICPEGHPVLVAASKLGERVICPRCFAPFLAEMSLTSSRHARKAESKSSRARDDDEDDDEEVEKPKRKKPAARKEDDDEEEEKPKRKKPAARKEDDDEEEKPKRKKPAAKKEDDDEEEEEEEEEEEQTPIEWTRRKRQLKMCANGLIAMAVGCYLLVAFSFFDVLWIDIFEMDLVDGGGPLMVTLFSWLNVPLLYLALTAFTVGMFMGLAVPVKAEAKGALIGGLVFSAVIYFLGLLTVLTLFGLLVSETRVEPFVKLLVGAAMVCFVLCMISVQAYLAKLMIFMKMHLESSQPITNMGFILLCYAGLLALVYASPLLKSSIAPWTCYGVALVADLALGFAIRTLIVHALLIMKLRAKIDKYVRDE